MSRTSHLTEVVGVWKSNFKCDIRKDQYKIDLFGCDSFVKGKEGGLRLLKIENARGTLILKRPLVRAAFCCCVDGCETVDTREEIGTEVSLGTLERK